MKKLLIAILAASVLALVPQSGNDLFQKALLMERTEGNLPEAIKLYQPIVDKFAGDRKLAAQALMRMAQCYEKWGQAEARKTYERLVRDYQDQNELVAEARAHLASLGGPEGLRQPASITLRKVSEDDMATPSADGRFLVFVDWDSGDLAVRDLVTGEKRRITHQDAWPNPPQSANAGIVSPDGKQIAYCWEMAGPGQPRTQACAIAARNTALSARVCTRAKRVSEDAPNVDLRRVGRRARYMSLFDDHAPGPLSQRPFHITSLYFLAG